MDFKHGLFAIALCALLLPSAFAIGVSPASQSMDNLLRGGYGEGTFKVFNTEGFPVVFAARVSGPQASWIGFSPSNTIRIEPHSSNDLHVVVKPPRDAANGQYRDYISIVSIPVQDQTGAVGAAVAVGVEPLLIITVTDQEIIRAGVVTMALGDFEEFSSGTIYVTILNTGNVRVSPNFKVTITDQTGKTVADYGNDGIEVLPTVSLQVPIPVPGKGLGIGNYTAHVQGFLRGQQIGEGNLGFSVVEVGGLRKAGVFETLYAPAKASSGETVKIIGQFRNSGTAGLDAKLVGEAYLGDSLAGPFAGDEIIIGADRSANLTAFFKPEKPGTYSLKAHVIFSKRVSEEKQAVVEVSSFDLATIATYAIAIIVVLAAIAYYFHSRNKGSKPDAIVRVEKPQPAQQPPGGPVA